MGISQRYQAAVDGQSAVHLIGVNREELHNMASGVGIQVFDLYARLLGAVWRIFLRSF